MCSICLNSYPNCPVCSPEVEPVICPCCDGEGVVYCDENGNQVPWEVWQKLPVDERMMEECENCGGSGEI